jgi:pentatricopeptide repeat protein
VEEMIQNGVHMDAKFYGTILDRLAKRGYWKEAKVIFEEIRRTAGGDLDTTVYDIMLSNTAKNGSFQDCTRYIYNLSV